ncbi:hypothetical protein [Demequina flava]|uniref:hypothetical protein n=1 Tax=Demequina flava TaxID=1095025 RepID=UPI00128E8140|nr:hypothetical protein [Demequina flava]
MIPTVLIIGLIVGIAPARSLRAKAIGAAVLATAWALLITFTLDGGLATVGVAWLVAAVNAALGIAVGAGLWALIVRVRQPASA